MTDPRTSVIEKRMRGIKRIVAVSSGKGGVGKSMVASTLALALLKRGCKVGLLDLDFTSPSTHTIIGVGDAKPQEDKGIVPPIVQGLEYMSIVYYSGDRAMPLRGADVSNALIELLSITRWSQLDFLVLDMPPGISDATMDLIRMIRRVEFLVVTTPSQLAFETVRKLLELLKELRIPVIGIVENMKMNDASTLEKQARALSVRLLNGIPYDTRLEEAIGNTDVLLGTAFAKEVQEVASQICTQRTHS